MLAPRPASDPLGDPALAAAAQDLARALARLLLLAQRPPPPPAAPAADAELLTYTAAARRLGVDRRAVAALVARGQLAVVHVGTRPRIPAAALAQLGQHGVAADVPTPLRLRRRGARR